ncbi:MAG: sugar kinase [Anaerolineae bacterium]
MEIISLGNMLVEVMRINLDEPLDQPGSFVGPYPSGDTPIYIDTVARLGGHRAGFIGAVGPDDLGKCLLERFRRDGVDFTRGRILPDYTTGVAFVAYFSDKSRRFVFHSRHAASGQLAPDQVTADYLADCRWLHITGCNLVASDSSRLACMRAMELLPAGAILSFDPNIRPEILSVNEIRDLCAPAIARADIILPSIQEAAMLTGLADDDAGCRLWADTGKVVVQKRGEQGCRLVLKGEESTDIPGFRVTEVDPTGAGDSFCAGITVARLEGMPWHRAARFANAVGALAVTAKGPMEGAPSRNQVRALLASEEKANG